RRQAIPAVIMRRYSGLTNLPDDIYRLVLRFMIGPRLHFCEEPQRDQLEARGYEQNSEEQQRFVLRERDRFDQTTDHEASRDHAANRSKRHADQSENLERAR